MSAHLYPCKIKTSTMPYRTALHLYYAIIAWCVDSLHPLALEVQLPLLRVAPQYSIVTHLLQVTTRF